MDCGFRTKWTWANWWYPCAICLLLGDSRLLSSRAETSKPWTSLAVQVRLGIETLTNSLNFIHWPWYRIHSYIFSYYILYSFRYIWNSIFGIELYYIIFEWCSNLWNTYTYTLMWYIHIVFQEIEKKSLSIVYISFSIFRVS